MPRPLPLGEVDLRSKDGEGEIVCLFGDGCMVLAFLVKMRLEQLAGRSNRIFLFL